MGIFIPELILQKYIGDFFAELKGNPALFEEMFEDVPKVGNLDYKTEAKVYFANTKKPEVRVGFNLGSIDKFSAVFCITLPAENVSKQILGNNSGEITIKENVSVETKEEFYNSNYAIIIAGKNADLCAILHRIYQWMFLRWRDLIENDGFLTSKFSAQDIIQQVDLIPADVFVRSIGFAFDFSISAPNGIVIQKAKSADFFPNAEMSIELNGAKKIEKETDSETLASEIVGTDEP
jgi:hypothetical protein